MVGQQKTRTGFSSNAQGQRLEFKYSTTANNIWRADDELLLQQQLQLIGIQLDIQNYPASTFFGTFLTDGKAGVYDIVEFENAWSYDADDSSSFSSSQIPPNGFNINFYSNKQLDALITQQESTADANARQQAFDQEHQIYLTECPFITLYSPVDIAVHKNVTQNYAPWPGGGCGRDGRCSELVVHERYVLGVFRTCVVQTLVVSCERCLRLVIHQGNRPETYLPEASMGRYNIRRILRCL